MLALVFTSLLPQATLGELVVTGRDDVMYGLTTDGNYVNGSPVTIEDGESLLVDFFERPRVRKADGTIVRSDGTSFTPGARHPSRSSRNIRRRTSEAATPIQALAELVSNAEETDTKHFVLENGDWVQHSQEKAKGMTTIVDEVDEVLPEVSEDARRRWSRFPGWPSGLKICRDEMEMPCNMPCYGGWMLVREIENGCCMNGPGGIDHPKPCGFTTKVCQKIYLCWD